MLFGIFVQTCVLTVMTLRTDWDQQVINRLLYFLNLFLASYVFGAYTYTVCCQIY